MQTDLSMIEGELDSQTFTWNDLDITCIPSSRTDTKELEGGGFELGADKILTVSLSNFPNGVLPISQQSVNFGGKQYRIEQVVTNVNSAFLRLFLVDKNKGV